MLLCGSTHRPEKRGALPGSFDAIPRCRARCCRPGRRRSGRLGSSSERPRPRGLSPQSRSAASSAPDDSILRCRDLRLQAVRPRSVSLTRHRLADLACAAALRRSWARTGSAGDGGPSCRSSSAEQERRSADRQAACPAPRVERLLDCPVIHLMSYMTAPREPGMIADQHRGRDPMAVRVRSEVPGRGLLGAGFSSIIRHGE